MSKDQDQGQDKSFDATPEKIRKARAKGNVPISTDLAVFLTFCGALLGITFVVGQSKAFGEMLAGFLWRPEEATLRLFAGDGGGDIGAGVMGLLAVILGPAAALVVLGLIVQQAIVFAPSKIKPELSKINPVEGIKRRYGGQGMAEFLRSGGKVLLVTIVGGFYMWGRREAYMAAMGTPLGGVLPLLVREVVAVLAIGAVVGLGVTMLDLPLRRMAHAKKLRMSRQEITDENKEMEGDPHQRQQRKQRAKEYAQAQKLREVERADVVIVNPTHYAVALHWERSADTVPVCIAKGTDHVALAMIERARLHGVPVREDPPCARALHATLKEGEPIQPDHFAAVAAAIRFADAVRRPSSSAD